MAGQRRAPGCLSSEGVPFRGHCCCLYEYPHQRLVVLTEFLRTALARREKCIYVARRQIAGALSSSLQAAGIDVERALESGALEWRRAEAAYGSIADMTPGRWAGAWRQVARRAEGEGYTGLAVASEAPRSARSGRRAGRWLECERRLTQAVAQLGGSFLCFYSRRTTPLRAALELLRAHPAGLASGLIGPSVRYAPAVGVPPFGRRPVVSPPGVMDRASDAGMARVSRAFTMGALTASIAHEVRQPLAAVAANANAGLKWLEGTRPRADLARRSLRRILRDTRRAADIITHVRSLATPGTTTGKRALPINTVVRRVVGLMEREIRGAGASLRLELADDVPQVIGDEVQLQQVLLNLLTNALEEMAAVRRRPREIAILTRRGPGGHVIVTVRDSGRSTNHETLARAFEPFYTTKLHGMGIGLSICRAIVEAHDGRLWATPNGSRGASFHFSLPSRPGARR